MVRRLAPRTLLGSYAGQLVSVADGVRLRSAPAPYASGDQPSPSGWGQRVRVQPRPGRGARSGYVSVGPTCDVTRVRAHKPSAQCPPPARSQPACRCLLHYLHEPGGSERCNARFFVDQQSKRVYVETVAVRHRTRTMQSVCGLAELDCILHRRPWTLATSFSSALATRGGATGRSRWEHAAHQSAHCQCCRRI